MSVLGLLVLVKTFLSRTLAVEIEGCWPWQPQKDEWHQPPTFKGGIRSALSCRSALAVAACQGACGQVIQTSSKTMADWMWGGNEKRAARARIHYKVGGVDGTRTRDPRRDRPVF